ncbi:MAG: hypothetical protein AAF638_01665 [Pseudomonadota bacterium]
MPRFSAPFHFAGRRARIACAVCFAFVLAACDQAGLATLSSGLDAPAGSVRVFNLIGPPEPVQKSVLAAIQREALEKNLDVRFGADAGGQYSINGYLVATPAGGSTEIAYVWDVFDDKGARAHRIAGQVAASTTASDPWETLTAPLQAEIATTFVDGIQNWQKESGIEPAPRPQPAITTGTERDAPAASAPAEPTETPSPTPSPTPGSPTPTPPEEQQSGLAPTGGTIAAAASIATIPAFFNRSTATTPSTAGAGTAFDADRTGRGIPVRLASIAGAPGDRVGPLKTAAATALAPYGIAASQGGARAQFILTSDVAVTPAEKGQQMMAIVWTVADDRGQTLGTVRQVRRLRAGTLADAWPDEAAKAAASAAQGLAYLMTNPTER